ncbi:MAG: anhydro-N-acetylmuramic acid kinase [Gammaproteobacteria bacterium]
MTKLFIGLMSGTSVNSVDAVLAEFEQLPPRLIACHEHPIAEPLREALLAFHRPDVDELDRAAQLDCIVARLFADAVRALLAEAGVAADAVRAIGSHGQTIRHAPQASEPYTVQIGNPSLIAELTGILTVADFRRRDMAAGGQGAPLAPAFHRAFFGGTGEARAVVNIGGIANITLLPADPEVPVSGFDTGPGNALLDAWAKRHLGTRHDHGGQWGAGGRLIPELLERFLDDEYFRRAPPKSTGREVFHADWIQHKLAQWGGQAAAQDVQVTLLALTVRTIADALRQHAPEARRLLVCGGGVHNPALMAALGVELAPLPVEPTAAHGVDPDFMEALGFAWLARQTLQGLPGNAPAVTGAAGPRILGGIYPAYVKV